MHSIKKNVFCLKSINFIQFLSADKSTCTFIEIIFNRVRSFTDGELNLKIVNSATVKFCAKRSIYLSYMKISVKFQQERNCNELHILWNDFNKFSFFAKKIKKKCRISKSPK